MSEMLYCIKHEKMVKSEASIHLETIRVNNAPDPGDRYDVEECVFPLGWATCPPPESNIESLAEQEPDRDTLDDPDGLFPFWVYEPATQTMVMEERVQ